MPNGLLVVLISVGAVGFFVVALSLTLLLKGHHIDGEISTNRHMQRLGIKCAVQQAREEAGAACDPAGTSPAEGGAASFGCAGNCSSCDIEHPQKG